MRPLRCLLGLFVAVVHSAPGPAQPDLDRALAVEAEVERIGRATSLWPGYDPLSIPLAIWVGPRTYLFRHTAPPEGFTRVAGIEPAVFVYEGRHPAVTSNSSAEIGGVTTGTILADGTRADQTPVTLAAVALHEEFHVFQRRHHRSWSGNEMDLLLYPVEDVQLLTLRREETEALRRATIAPDNATSACWARQALAFRRDRYSAMQPPFSAYERATELNEGLAAYVQIRAQGRTTVEFPPSEFQATAVRQRIYTVGPALAFLLDRFRPG